MIPINQAHPVIGPSSIRVDTEAVLEVLKNAGGKPNKKGKVKSDKGEKLELLISKPWES